MMTRYTVYTLIKTMPITRLFDPNQPMAAKIKIETANIARSKTMLLRCSWLIEAYVLDALASTHQKYRSECERR